MLPLPERSDAQEILDREGNQPEDLRGALRDIRWVNRLLGGRRAILLALRPLLLEAGPGRHLELLDVGTGDADLPVAMIRQARALGRDLAVTAIERDPATAAIALARVRGVSEIRVVRADATRLPFADRAFDLVTASLFLHHFRDGELQRLLGRLRALCTRAVIVNDLRRDRLACLSIRWLSRATLRHPMFVHDAPLSVLRGFTAAELLGAARAAGAPRASVRRRYLYRLVLTVPAHDPGFREPPGPPGGGR
jgi:SAM-dependent methyltransferase